jgi:hypothetical protein
VRLWIDTEFNEYKGDLISIALVDEDERSFYAVLPCERPGAWVAEHVIPVLMRRPEPLGFVQEKLEFWLSGYGSVHIVADWPEDLKYFLDLLITGPGTRLDTPPLTMEVRRDLEGVKSEVPHNALHDAVAIRLSHLAIEQRAK